MRGVRKYGLRGGVYATLNGEVVSRGERRWGETRQGFRKP